MGESNRKCQPRVCCGAGRSSAIVSSSAVRPATGAARTAGATSAGFVPARPPSSSELWCSELWNSESVKSARSAVARGGNRVSHSRTEFGYTYSCANAGSGSPTVQRTSEVRCTLLKVFSVFSQLWESQCFYLVFWAAIKYTNIVAETDGLLEKMLC